jgi:hypothetical protein
VEESDWTADSVPSAMALILEVAALEPVDPCEVSQLVGLFEEVETREGGGRIEVVFELPTLPSAILRTFELDGCVCIDGESSEMLEGEGVEGSEESFAEEAAQPEPADFSVSESLLTVLDLEPGAVIVRVLILVERLRLRLERLASVAELL